VKKKLRTQLIKIFLLLFVVLIFSSKNVNAQNLYFITKKAERLVASGQIEKGQFFFEKALKKDSLYSRANIGLAKLNFNHFGNFDKSVDLFEKGIKYTKKDTNYYYLYEYANVLSLRNQPKNAIKLYNLILEQDKLLSRDPEFKMKVKHKIEGCERQKVNTKLKESNVKISNLGDIVNSERSEYTPILSSDNQSIIYNGRYKDFTKENRFEDDYFFENIYQSNYNGDTTKLCKHNYKNNVHFAVVNNVGESDSIIVYYENELWISNKMDTVFYGREPLPNTLRGFYHQPSGVFSTDQTLFIFSAKKTKKDDLDLFYSHKDGNGTWSEPIEFDSTINSEFDEDGVFLADNDSSLYFSSKGFNTSGEYDIFKSELIDNKWSKGKALAYPINSPANDIYYVIDKNNIAFLSSNRYGGYGLMDIYKIQQPLKPVFNCPEFKNPNLTVDFDLTESIQDNMVDLKYNWYFDDGTTAKGPILSKTFNFPGRHEIKIDIIDESIGLIEKREIEKVITIDSVNYIGYQYNNIYLVDSIGTFNAEVSYMKNHSLNQYYWKVNDSILNTESAVLNYTFTQKDTFDVSLQINSTDDDGNFKSFCYTNQIVVIDATDLLTKDSLNTNHDYVSSDSITDLLDQSDLLDFGIEPIYFRFDKANLSKKSIKKLNNIVDYLNSHPSARLIVYGNTDAMGSDAYNHKLAKRRIVSTIKYLNSKNIGKERIIKTVNNGESNPVEPNVLENGKDNPNGRRLNRRVEFKVIK